jgi:glycosyltransferase involved in cell wall biosynthesis
MAGDLRVFIKYKSALFSSRGGELVHLENMSDCLSRKGVKIGMGDRLPDKLSDYDIIHYFNLEACEESEFKELKGIPKALTPIFPCGNSLFLFADLYEEWPRPGGLELADRLRYFLRRVTGLQAGRITRACSGLHYDHVVCHARKQAIINKFDLFTPSSYEEMWMIRSFFCIDKPAFEVVRNDVDLKTLDVVSDYAERNLPDEKFVMCSGGIGRRKNQYMLAKAMLDMDTPLVFAGGDEEKAYFDSVKRLAARKKNVFFLDHLSREDLYSVYKAAHVHALPSFFETPGRANLEAVAHECVNVASTIGGLKEYLGDYSLYCNPYSADHIREQIEAALTKPPNREGAAFVRKNLNTECTADVLLRAYNRLLNNQLQALDEEEHLESLLEATGSILVPGNTTTQPPA